MLLVCDIAVLKNLSLPEENSSLVKLKPRLHRIMVLC